MEVYKGFQDQFWQIWACETRGVGGMTKQRSQGTGITVQQYHLLWACNAQIQLHPTSHV